MQAPASFLRTIDIFSELTEGELEEISGVLQREVVAKSKVLFREGDAGNELFIVEAGSFGSSIKLPDGAEREIAVFKAGNFFGEMSIFEQAPRSATCYAKEESAVLRLADVDFFSLLSAQPELAIKVMYRMLTIVTQRLESTGAFLSDMVTWGEKARKRAITDELTGVYNRKYLEDVVSDYFRSAERNHTPLTLAMVDLDRFREINEEYGNKMGDRAILEAVAVFRRILPDKDIVARYGGDEFTVLLPETSLEQARAYAEEIRKEVEGLTFLKEAGGSTDRVTTSQGLATYPECARDLKGLRAAADEALYRAKDAGKNRVVCADRLAD